MDFLVYMEMFKIIYILDSFDKINEADHKIFICVL